MGVSLFIIMTCVSSFFFFFFFFNDTATTEIYTLSLHDALPIRVPGEISKEKLDVLRLADEIFLEEIHRAGLYDKIWQAFAVLLPVRTVGVMGDGRTYDEVVALRAVTSTDGMTADFYPFDMDFLGR